MLIAGAFLLLLGLASGLFLCLGALGALHAAPGLSLWLLYPSLSIVGFLLVALASRTAHLGSLTRLASGAVLALALAAAAGLVLSSASLLPRADSPLALWVVLGVGLLLGSAGLVGQRPVSGRA